MAILGLATVAAPFGYAASLASHPVVVAVRHGDCTAAVNYINQDAASNDAVTAFLAGRMLDEGVCVKQDPATATYFFERAANLGDHSATLDYAAHVGLGEDVPQSYERAGTLCREAGTDPKAELQTYALGYACTVGDLAAKLLRETLPKGAFRSNSGPLLVDFTPGTAQMHIRSTPGVGLEEAHTGTNLPRPLIDAPKEIEKAWRSAIAAAPSPDASSLGNNTVELTLDVDMTLEPGRQGAQRMLIDNMGALGGGDVRPAGR
jgi:hypothetical protein